MRQIHSGVIAVIWCILEVESALSLALEKCSRS